MAASTNSTARRWQDSPCPPSPPATGRYGANDKAAECADCPGGYFAPITAEVECSGCQAGLFQPEERQPNCTSCPANFYQSNNESVRCLDCELGQYSLTQAAVCTHCSEVSMFTRLSVVDDGCVECDGQCPNETCAGGYTHGRGDVSEADARLHAV